MMMKNIIKSFEQVLDGNGYGLSPIEETNISVLQSDLKNTAHLLK